VQQIRLALGKYVFKSSEFVKKYATKYVFISNGIQLQSFTALYALNISLENRKTLGNVEKNGEILRKNLALCRYVLFLCRMCEKYLFRICFSMFFSA